MAPEWCLPVLQAQTSCENEESCQSGVVHVSAPHLRLLPVLYPLLLLARARLVLLALLAQLGAVTGVALHVQHNGGLNGAGR